MGAGAFVLRLYPNFSLTFAVSWYIMVVDSTFSLRPAAPAFVEFAMKSAEHNTIRPDGSARTCGAVALTLGWRWYFDLFYFWFTYLKGGSLGK